MIVKRDKLATGMGAVRDTPQDLGQRQEDKGEWTRTWSATVQHLVTGFDRADLGTWTACANTSTNHLR